MSERKKEEKPRGGPRALRGAVSKRILEYDKVIRKATRERKILASFRDTLV